MSVGVGVSVGVSVAVAVGVGVGVEATMTTVARATTGGTATPYSSLAVVTPARFVAGSQAASAWKSTATVLLCPLLSRPRLYHRRLCCPGTTLSGSGLAVT